MTEKEEVLKSIYEFALAEARLLKREDKASDEAHALSLLLGSLVGGVLKNAKNNPMGLYESLFYQGKESIKDYLAK